MTAMIQGSQILAITMGVKVENSAGKTLPANATSTIFTVSGGRVLVTSLVGIVTTVVGGTTPAAKLIATPTVGTANDLCTTGTVTGDEVGTMYSLPGPVGSALNISGSGSGGVTGQTAPVVVNAGTIGINCSAADATGAVKWALTYIPLDSGASVVAA